MPKCSFQSLCLGTVFFKIYSSSSLPNIHYKHLQFISREGNYLISHICCLWDPCNTMVSHQFCCKQGQLQTKAKPEIILGNRPLKSANFLWVPCPLCLRQSQGLMLLLRKEDGAACGRQLHSFNLSPISGMRLPLLPHPAFPIASAEAACPPRGQTLKTRAGSWSDRQESLNWAWWKFADAKAVFSDTTLHAAVTSVITDLANFFSRQSSSKMANRLSFCIVYLLGSGE